ncbi:MAG: FAD-dependent oxidoreductase [Fuerstiella sp.]|nr:FAD-dependent oxidoreductase [Fuerstiella sp.]
MKRRDFVKALSAAVLSGSNSLWADDGIDSAGEIIKDAKPTYRGGTPYTKDGKIIQPQREIPVIRDTDVLVVGGGCAGVIAALAARRAGVKVTLVERYGCFGGLWTAGLVLPVLATHKKTPAGRIKMIHGIGDELLARIHKVRNGTIYYSDSAPQDALTDPEITKSLIADMLREEGVDILLHSWVTNAVMDGTDVKGAIFESKSGCHAVRSKVVVDASGDGDLYDAAGAENVRHIHRIGLVHRLGNMGDATSIKGLKLGNKTPTAGVNWVNMMGPYGDGLDVATLTQMELDDRQAIWASLMKIQNNEQTKNVFLLDVASQLGVRASRTLAGMHEMSLDEALAGKKHDDVVGVGGVYTFIKNHPVQIPYGALVPRRINNVLAAGRCVAADNKMMNYTRLIGPCLLTGQAAGAAAALAVQTKTNVRDVSIPRLQGLLKRQNVFLG